MKTIRQVVGVKIHTVPTMSTLARKRPSISTSEAHGAICSRWMAEAQEAGKCCVRDLTEEVHWVSGTVDWPMWLSIVGIQMLLLEYSGGKVSVPTVCKWANNENLKRRKFRIDVPVRGGKKFIKSQASMFNVGALKPDPY